MSKYNPPFLNPFRLHMKLEQIVEKYDTALLDQISADKIDEAISLRLPQPVVIQEIGSALSSQSYISGKLLYARPPTYAIVNLILQAPGCKMEAGDFHQKVLQYVRELSGMAAQSKNRHEHNPQLYIKILRKALENDGLIDKNEAQILEVVKSELGIWDREHFIFMHDESILGLWDIGNEYYLARNRLLATGIVLTHDDNYVIAEEVAPQIRKVFGIEIMDDAHRRLLAKLSKEELSMALDHCRLNVSGSKEALVERMLSSLAPPSEILNLSHLESLREFCRRENIQASGAKNAVISHIIQHFDDGSDVSPVALEEPMAETPSEPELREMDATLFAKLLFQLTGQQLYDILYRSGLMTSGSKEDRVKRLLESRWSERYHFNCLRKEDLAQLNRKLSIPVSGSKQELVDRLLDFELPPGTVPAPETAAGVAEATSGSQPASASDAVGLEERMAMPPGWEEVNAAFPELDSNEKIVVAILKEAKSVTEQDLERIAQKRQLGWFLLKAHMAELIAKLRKARTPWIQIKSVQNTNIYQWVAADTVDRLVLEKKSARDIIDALRHGVVPKHHLDLLMVGQQEARNHLEEMLLDLPSKKSHFKFIRGQYGSGKTFLCSWLKDFALDNEFAVSFINISHDQPLSDLPVFFSGMINGLRTPEKADSGALVDILESWLLHIHNRTATLEGIDPCDGARKPELISAVERSIEIELANLTDIEPGFAMALRAFYQGKVSGDRELASHAVAWITGSRSLSTQALRDIGVRGYLEANNVFARMRAILEIMIGARYRGLLLLVDELELVRKFPHARQREQALETLRLLIDEAGRNALPGCLMIFTGTDEFFEDERYGLKSYEALAERVMTTFKREGFVSMRQPIIQLESLDRERLTSMIMKIRDLYGIAYSWEAGKFADDGSVAQMITDWTMFGEESVDRKPRPVIREFIHLLDLCEENKGVSLIEFLQKSKSASLPTVSYHKN